MAQEGIGVSPVARDASPGTEQTYTTQGSLVRHPGIELVDRWETSMPTGKPRSSWIIEPQLVADLKKIAEYNRRTISFEAQTAISSWIEQHRGKVRGL